MADISSKDNKYIKLIKQLETKKIRDELSLFVIEGPNLIQEALQSEAVIKAILIRDASVKEAQEQSKESYSKLFETLNFEESDDLLNMLSQMGIKYYTVEKDLFNSIADTQNSQGAIAIIQKIEYSDEILHYENSFVIIIDKLQDPGNLGTIIRTAQAGGVTCIGIVKGSGDIYSSKVVRATAGAIFKTPFIFFENEKEAIEKLKVSGNKIFCTTVTGGNNYFHEDLKDRLALVIGNEGNGASEEFILAADKLISIPMLGGTESLNAAIAASIIIYERVRQNLFINK
jgi:TrmH family RNA methyltransferase